MVGTKQKPLIMQPVREKSWLNPALGDSLRRRITRKPRSLFIRGDHLISLLTDGLLRVMKDKNAVFRNPILRPELRLEARKLIGDTGLWIICLSTCLVRWLLDVKTGL